jgi:ASC-1-like (ASCH) protein
MDHVGIMKKEWGFIDKILRGQKTIESRWYLNKYKPWGIIKKGDLVYFKNSGELVIARAEVKKVVQFSGLNTQKVQEILGDYCQSLGIEPWDIPLWRTMLAHKKYGILLFLKNPKLVTPFQINKKGFGAMASWISVQNINDIKIL